jgi:lipopolysaccharide cholinephosphotransferase
MEWSANGLDMKRIQQRLFNMGATVADIFEKHDIKYMIAYGTLLGAVRHNDLIPWDDDFDLFLFKEDYYRACVWLREELPDTMFLEDSSSEPVYFHAWAHVKDLNSKCVNSRYPADGFYVHKGLHVDLYRIEKMLASEIPSYLRSENIAYIDRRKKFGLISDDDYKRREKKTFENYFLGDEHGSKELYVVDGAYKQRTLCPNHVFPLRQYFLREKAFWGPSDADAILKSIYGDYWRLPDISNRKPQMDLVEFLD